MSTYTVLYHKHCADGAAAALAAWFALGDAEARYIPCAYGDPLPEIERGSDVYMLDFTARPAETLALAQIAGRITILDHHASAAADLDGLPEIARNTLGACEIRIHFDLQRSGCALAWLHFHAERRMPRLLRWIEDRDLWRFDYPESKPLHYAIDVDADFRDLARAILDPELLDTWVADGERILAHLEPQWAAVAATAGPLLRWHGDPVAHLHRAPTAVLCNCPPQWFSDVGQLLLQREDTPEIAILYHDSEHSGRRSYSLRSRDNGPDVSRIAAHYHGGGHPRAAGFRRDLDDLPLGLLRADRPDGTLGPRRNSRHPDNSAAPADTRGSDCCGRCTEEPVATITTIANPRSAFVAAPPLKRHPLEVCE